jgi:hypothetical protein
MTLPLKSGYDAVFTVWDFFDIPRSGVANFRGSPHFYDCIFDEEADSYSLVYVLTPIGEEAFEAAKENWEIVLRYCAAVNSGKVAPETLPALPEERTRHQETKQIIQESIASNHTRSVRAKGTFDSLVDTRILIEVITPWAVKWDEPDDPKNII